MRTILKTTIVLACAASLGLAQDPTAPPPPPDGPHRGPGRGDPVAMLTTTLSLTSDQQTEVRAIFEIMRLKMTEIMEDSTLSKEAKMAKLKELRVSTDVAIKALLTTDQQKKFDELQKNRPRRPGDRQHGPDPGPPPGE